VDTIEPGVDFAEEISRAVATCKVLLAVIGPNWLTEADERGRRRLDDPDDIVRLEIEAALARDVRVIPILVEGAVMPGRQDLPESLAGLARRNALFIRHESFRYDAGRLVTTIERVLATSPSTGIVPQSPPTTDAAALIVPDAHNVRPDGNALGEAVQKGPERVRGDRARVTRLIGDAERIAQSITSERSKASALAQVAGALAATDPDRATQLTADAERIAQSITSVTSKELALTEVAGALAATDPDRAERIAQSITSWHSKELALTEVAKALAATDPDRAERIAQPAVSSRSAAALVRVAKALAANDPDRAELIAQSIIDGRSRASALVRVAGALAATDPDRAERIAQSITNGRSKVSALVRIAKA